MTAHSASQTHATSSGRIATALFALVLGVFFVYGAGFASADALHDTAHDARHAMGLPCH
ncbi:CbtB-domain containing protein [Aureimonas altamirensis]|uniref:CbtB domain-containing protein n=1 Tax=Aureimonas altamirensis TaxID=370622 RepID=UPI002036F9AB|nr:CbtB-domain containing protein [Aureimonas altamirensis]MCM2504032.1 CbtB-domain containing protein [Aureimonas altamirensis]